MLRDLGQPGQLRPAQWGWARPDLDRWASPMKLWGGRFSRESAPSAEAFTASIAFDHRLWRHDLMGSAVHARMLAAQGILSPQEATAILSGLTIIAEEFERGELDLSAPWEDIHTQVEARLTEIIGESAGKLHTARSRNDQVALDLRLYAREAILDECAAVLRLADALTRLAEQHAETLFPGYTHLQLAQPVVFGHHLLAYAEMFERDVQRLLDCYERTNVMPLGSGALAGVPYPIDRQAVAQALGFPALTRNSLDAVSDRDFVIEQVADLALVAMHLSRLAEELVLWSSAEFGLVQIDEAYTTGSSIMPQKRNPDVAELVRAKTGRTYGDLVALLTVLKGLPLAYNRDLQEDKPAYFDACDTVLAAVQIMAELVPGVRVRTERAAAAAAAGLALATDYADYLARQGVPFREAHRAVGLLVQLCERTGRSLEELTLAELQAASPAFGEDVLNLSLRDAVAARDVPGGTAPARVRTAASEAVARLAGLTATVEGLRAALPTLPDLLKTDVA